MVFPPEFGALLLILILAGIMVAVYVGRKYYRFLEHRLITSRMTVEPLTLVCRVTFGVHTKS